MAGCDKPAAEGYDGTVPPLTFAFRFAAAYRAAALPFGVHPSNARVVVTDAELRADFGPWHLSTPLANVTGTTVTGPYKFVFTAGPAHLSFTDRGLTFATNADRGLCIRFADPVPGIAPTARLRHPGLTVTVDDVEGLAAALAG